MFFLFLFLYALLLLPLGCFLVAAVAEIRSRDRGQPLFFFLRMVEIAAGIVGVLAIPSKFWSTPVISPRVVPELNTTLEQIAALRWGTTVISSEALSWIMVCLSLLLGGLSLVSKYASRVALTSMLIGSAILAFWWYHNGAYHH